MAVTPPKNTFQLASKAPNLPIAPVDYSQQYMDQVLNALRLYFNQIDNYTQGASVPDSGTTLNRPIDNLFVGQQYFDTTLNQLLLWNGSTWVPATPASAVVSSFSAGSTGLTPNSATAGAIVLAGILGITNGGTGLSSIGANGTVLTSNGTSAAWNAPATISGAIQMWPTTTAPTGYLLCNGASVSTTTYATLFGVIGYTFGGGGGSFLLPNYTNRMPIGAGSSYGINSQGGSADAVVVSHNHSINDPTHQHLFGGDDMIGSQGGYSSQSSFSYDAVSTASGGGQNFYTHDTNNVNQGQPTGITINNQGVSGTNANLPPYLGINFIIKT